MTGFVLAAFLALVLVLSLAFAGVAALPVVLVLVVLVGAFYLFRNTGVKQG